MKGRSGGQSPIHSMAFIRGVEAHANPNGGGAAFLPILESQYGDSGCARMARSGGNGASRKGMTQGGKPIRRGLRRNFKGT